MSGAFDALLYVLYCKQQGWWKVGLVYSDNEWSREVANVFISEAANNGIRIVNEDRNISDVIDESNADTWHHKIDQLIEHSRILILITFIENARYILEYLVYEKGA